MYGAMVSSVARVAVRGERSVVSMCSADFFKVVAYPSLRSKRAKCSDPLRAIRQMPQSQQVQNRES